MVTLKDLAQEMCLHPRVVKRWWKRLRVPPDVRGHSCHRWSKRRAALLLKRWQDYWQARGRAPEIVRAKATGEYQDKRQLTFRFK